MDSPSDDNRLIFVYNAESGLVSALKDYVHKSVRPQTYQCNLCALTYGSLGMKNDWATFVDGLRVPVEFLHRDELRERYGIENVLLPALMKRDSEGIELLISAKEINALRTLDELKDLVSIRVGEWLGG
jgi:hypothetical protein